MNTRELTGEGLILIRHNKTPSVYRKGFIFNGCSAFVSKTVQCTNIQGEGTLCSEINLKKDMQNFQDWYILLIEDERFYENASRNHRKETVEETARKVYEIESVDRDAFEVKPMAEHRKHLLNKLYKLPPDKVKKNWHEIALEEKQQEEAKNKPPEEPPLVRGSEQYLKRTQEFIEAIQNAPMMKKQAPLTARERIEGENLRPKPEIKEPTEIEKRSAYVRHLKRVRESRSMLFLEAYPDAQPEEVQEYLNKFAHIDNPLQLDI